MATSSGNIVVGSGEKESALTACLEELRKECDKNTVRIALETLLKLANNAILHPKEEKYRKIRTENKNFNAKVWSIPEAQQFLMVWGWIEADDVIVLPADDGLHVIQHVLQNKLSSMPSTKPKHEHPLSEKEKALQEERRLLKEKAKLEKEERDRIKAQIRADRENIKTREVHDSKATKFHGDGQMTKFKDIGVNPEEGGGG